METVVTYGIIYLLVFRLAIILLGGLCIFYGYRLFLIGYEKAESGNDVVQEGGELSGKIGNYELLLKTGKPGIFFTAFGAIIVIAVLAGNQPDIRYREEATSQTQTGPETTKSSFAGRTTPQALPISADQQAGAEVYSDIVNEIPEAIARLKTEISRTPENASLLPDYLDLLARLHFAWGEKKEAAEQQQRAVNLVDQARKADFISRLEMYRR